MNLLLNGCNKKHQFHGNHSEVFMLERIQMKPEYQSITQMFSKLSGTISRICDWIKILTICCLLFQIHLFIYSTNIYCVFLYTRHYARTEKNYSTSIYWIQFINYTINIVISRQFTAAIKEYSACQYLELFFTTLKFLDFLLLNNIKNK